MSVSKKIEVSCLRDAVVRNELYLVYQPQLDSISHKVKGVEALLRWDSKIYGNVSPNDFIPVAEETGLILPIGNWVLEEACKQLKEWNERYNILLPVSVNVSAVQLRDYNFTTSLYKTLDKYRVSPESVGIEITESTLIENYEKASTKLKELQEFGISIALDDFGTGYSSLNYLKNLPLDSLKIDKSFIENLKSNNKEHAIVGSIINLAHILDLSVIAEGVETRDQLECLVAKQCDMVQGYYFSKPISSGDFEKLWIESFIKKTGNKNNHRIIAMW